ncbi:uncharacterized protein LOC108111316 [Drosophila eugracilis]|uniref:uncharacterized protein LOC108111316 n=1 Tax=Drosophila eugracilis TaxID=29029 RepID=UPI001BD96F0F|nr:uncharacterized protein LOC108111316 [Drosophila eugracilis]
MASYEAVCTASFIHLILGLAVWFKPPAESCSPAPNLGSWIFVGAPILLATDIRMYPKRYMHLPYAIQFLVETVGSLAIIEFSAIVVWCALECLIHHLVRLLFLSCGMGDETYLALEYWLLLIPTTALASTLLYIMKMAIIPHIPIKSIYEKQQIKVQLDERVYNNLVRRRNRSKNKYG